MHPGALKAREAAVVPARLRHRRVNKNGGGSDTCWREEAVGPGAAQNAEEGRSRGGGERGSRPKGSLGARGAGQSPPPTRSLERRRWRRPPAAPPPAKLQPVRAGTGRGRAPPRRAGDAGLPRRSRGRLLPPPRR